MSAEPSGAPLADSAKNVCMMKEIPEPADTDNLAGEIKVDMPTPADTDSMAWAVIEEVAQRRHNAAARALHTFKSDDAFPFRTEKGDVRTNIIDQGEKVTYALSPDMVKQLMGLLEACRLEATACHDSERQGTAQKPRSGTMLDFDITTTTRNVQLQDRQMYRLIGALVSRFQRDIDFLSQLPAMAGQRSREIKIHIFFIVKPEATLVSEGRWRYGTHILIPGPMLSRAYKKWAIHQLKDDPSVASVMRELGAVDPGSCLDQNSASVPVLFFGSCKRGKTPYTLAAAFEVIFESVEATEEGALRTDGWVPPPVIRKLTEAEMAPYNLVYEMCLTTEASYDDGKEPLVRKFELECRDSLRLQIEDLARRTQDNIVDHDDILVADNRLSTLTIHDAEARELHGLLDLLPEEYYTKYPKWRDVLFALASTSESYKPLGEWFSLKCPRKWVFGGASTVPRAQTFEQVWQDAVDRIRAGSLASPLTKRSLIHWAREANPAKFREVTGRGYFSLLTQFVYDYDGGLEHYMIGKMLVAMLSQKFCVDVEPGRGTYVWFEFVIAGQSMASGEVWKWRREAEPDEIQLYLSEQIPKVIDRILDHLKERQDRAQDENQAKYYKELVKAVKSSKRKLHNDRDKGGIIKQCRFLFRNRGFLAALDKQPDLLGVQQGVLKLGSKTTLLDHFHEYPISMHTSVRWHKFDPDNNPWDMIIIDMIAGILPEPDARDWIMFFLAQTVHGGAKEGIILLFEGGGQNGKTALLKAVAKALGPYWKKLNINLFVSERESADKPNSAFMALKSLRGGYVEELNKTVPLNVARMKEIVNPGDVTGCEKYKTQEEFSITCNIVLASQYSFIIDTRDHGTWRRIVHYTAKTKFRKNPDPNNPFEKKDDQRFVRTYPDDPEFQSSMLSFLVYYHERLVNEFDGEIKNVKSPTIERETEVFRNSQDMLNRFISERVVISPNSGLDYPLSTVSSHFSEWFSKHIDQKRHVASDIIKEIESSALMKYLRPVANNTLVLLGCRILTQDDHTLREGEEFLSMQDMRGKVSAEQWKEAIEQAKNLRAPRERWWEPPPKEPATPILDSLNGIILLDMEDRAKREDNVAEEPLLDIAGGDWELLQAESLERRTALEEKRAALSAEADRTLNAILSDGPTPLKAAIHHGFDLNDVYE
jgi:phage/plasmid-associated DNA primase